MAAIFLETYGCQMNEYDSELVRSILSEHSFAPSIEQADVILINTCAVRENAYNKIYSRVGHLKHLRQKKGVKIGILGCMAQNLKDRLLDPKSGVDFVVGPDNYKSLRELIENSDTKAMPEQTVVADLSEYETYSDIAPTRVEGVNAWIAIMRGCDNFCSFCVVPYTRGRERSRSLESVVAEATAAVNAGHPQITLLGQNVNSYKSENYDFADLMEAVSHIPNLKRVRFTSPHPKDFPQKLLEVIAARPNLCKQIHLPLQSGNSQVLERMHRGYSKEDFMEVVARIRKTLPEAFISTDIIIGFPGETKEQFLETRQVMEEVGFESAYIFKYSPREQTLAKKKFLDDVSEDEKTNRIVELNRIQRKLSSQALEKFVGKKLSVMIESESSHLSTEQCQGRADNGVTVVCTQDGSLKIGQMLDVEIFDKTAHVLLARPFKAALTEQE